MFDSGLDLEADIDLTPVIDVVFMLLIFFIMTTDRKSTRLNSSHT